MAVHPAVVSDPLDAAVPGVAGTWKVAREPAPARRGREASL